MHDNLIRDFSDEQPETPADTQFVSCIWCERIHAGKHPLSVCPECVARYSTLRLLKMRGSYPLNGRAIDEALTRTSAGNYALGYMDGDSFSVFYVGRSDSDVRGRLHEWVGNAGTSYTHFAYSYSHSAAAAFAKESCNFEDFGGSGALDNQVEPVSMAG
jgi:hypothetical protein